MGGQEQSRAILPQNPDEELANVADWPRRCPFAEAGQDAREGLLRRAEGLPEHGPFPP